MQHNPSDHLIFLTLRVGKLLRSRMLALISEKIGVEVPGHCIGVLADLYMEDGQRQQDLAISSINDKSNITKMVGKLEKQGFIFRKSDPIDGRSKRIYLTEKSKSFLEQVFQMAVELEARVGGELSKNDFENTKTSLLHIYQNLLAGASLESKG